MRSPILAAMLGAAMLAGPALADAAEWRATRVACKSTYEGWLETHGPKMEEIVRHDPEASGTIRWDSGTRAQIIVRPSDGEFCVVASKFLGREQSAEAVQ